MTIAEEFLDRTRSHPIRYASWLDRSESLDHLAHIQLPEPRSEAWKYSNPNHWYGSGAPIGHIQRMIELKDRGWWNPGEMKTHEAKFDAVNDAYDQYENYDDEIIKIVMSSE